MDKQQAQRLVKDTLENPFDKQKFIGLIKNILNRFEEKKFTYKGNTIHKDFSDSIKIVERIGQYKDLNQKTIDILIIQLKRESILDRARTKQRNYIAKYLKGSRGGQLKDAALVAFVSPNQKNWRFSFVKMEYKFDEQGKVKEEWTPARRYSFLVGKNESSHTAKSCLLPILQNEESSCLEDLESAFSVEKVTKEFFEKYRELFLKLEESLDKVIKKDRKIESEFKNKKISTVDFSKKLLGQIVFIYFLQKKGWFGVKRKDAWGYGSKAFMRELFKKEHCRYNNFFNDILEPLFYEALQRERTDDYYSRFDCRIPFLNGGLFDPINSYDWVNTDIFLPNELFSNNKKTNEGDIGDGILDIFDRYNFTVKEDEPLEKEVAVDPEMLGKVFENLLEVKDRKSKGTYYTPREIVHYMCQESLTNYLNNELKEINREDIEILIKHGESVIENENQIINQRGETKTYSHKLPKTIRQQARLIDQKLANIRICDPAIGSGAFPVGMMNEIIKARNTLTSFITNEKNRDAYHFKLHAIQHCLYGVDIDLGAIEIAKLRLWLSLVVDEDERKNIQPLPNLDYKIVRGNSLLEYPYTPRGLEDIEKLKTQFFKETRPNIKEKLKEQIDEKINSLFANTQKSLGYKVDFDFKINFSDVFSENQGFDVIIANPPYVKESVNKSAFDGLKKSPYYQGKMDLWYMFACRGIDISKNLSGIITFIAQNNWVTSHGASKMRNKVIKDTQILNLIDFGDFKIFDAGIQTMIIVFKKSTCLEEYTFDCRKALQNFQSKDIVSILKKEDNPFTKYLNPNINRQKHLNQILTFNTQKVENILNKLSLASNLHLEYDELGKGIEHSHDKVNKDRHRMLQQKYKIGTGIFALTDKEKNDLLLTERELELIKPYYTTKELSRWYGNPKNKEWIIYTDSSFKNKIRIKDYQNIKRHLDQFQTVITSANKPYGLHRSRKEEFFIGEKIIVTRKCRIPTFTYVDFPSYVSATFYVIKTSKVNQKYLVGVLNSKLIAFWLKYKGKMQGFNYQIDKGPLMAIPLSKPSDDKQKPIIELVSQIIHIFKSKDNLGSDKQDKISEYEKQIDQLVYKLYGLTPKEIKIVEDS